MSIHVCAVPKMTLRYGQIVLLLAVVGGCGREAPPPSSQSATTTPPVALVPPVDTARPVVPAPKPDVPYRVVKRWAIRNGGSGMLIVVEPSIVTADLAPRLGATLRKNLAGERNAFVQIFSSERAALQSDAAMQDQLSSKDLAYYDKHMLGSYTHNANTGFEGLDFFPNGVDGPSKSIRY